MKKVININFQGRIIPIEETAYDMLKQYVESLRIFFANEEGKDEIINDIEGRIAELFEQVLKKGSTCINDGDVVNIINSMGRPEDFEADEEKVYTKLGSDQAGSQTSGAYAGDTKSGRGKLYRDENHKILGGVCSGLANYFNIDPVITRILFILFFGIAFWVYLVMWIAVPNSSSVILGSQRRRLFRDTDSKMIAGVCSGLAAYFSVQVWVPRILFLVPFLSFVFRWGNWGFWDFPHFLSFSFSPGAIVIYIILWLVIPEAKSSADKLEMKGEKVDLNNIKSTIQGDLEGFKDKAQAFGNEVKERAQVLSENISTAGRRMGAEASAAGKRTGGGLGNAIAVIAKIFAYFILGSILLSIVIGLFSIGIVFTGFLPAYSFVLDSNYQEVLAWCSLIFFIWVPVIAIVTWIIRRIAGKKGNSGAIRLTFLTLWILGVICFVNLLISVGSEFRYRNQPFEQAVGMSNPGVNKLEIKSLSGNKYYDRSWLRLEPFDSVDGDTVLVKNISLRIVKAVGDSFQVSMVKLANGSSRPEAARIASKINFNIEQVDGLLMIDKGISINRQDKFRNQHVIVTVAVPVGKRIFVNDNIGWGSDIRVNIGRDNDYNDWEDNEETFAYNWRHRVEYIMTTKGLERVDKMSDNSETEEEEGDAIEQYRKSREQVEAERNQKQRELDELNRELDKPADTTQPKTDSSRYRYTPRRNTTDTRVSNKENRVDKSFSGRHNLLMINVP